LPSGAVRLIPGQTGSTIIINVYYLPIPIINARSFFNPEKQLGYKNDAHGVS
jgi:hypothetical protein